MDGSQVVSDRGEELRARCERAVTQAREAREFGRAVQQYTWETLHQVRASRAARNSAATSRPPTKA
jgi:hypothetical protein